MDFCIWDKCNNRCLMCSNPDLPWSDDDEEGAYEYDKIIARLEKQIARSKNDPYADKIESLLFTGGEPTLQPKFLELIEYLNKEYPEIRIGVLSNGRIFSYLNFAKSFLKHDNMYIGLSLYGHDAESHDKITQVVGSFAQTVKGIANVLATRNSTHEVELRTVISGMSYRNLDKTLEFIGSSFPDVDRVAMIFVEYEGQLMRNLDKTKVTYKDVAPYLNRAYEHFDKIKEVRLFHFPLCALDKKLWPYMWRTLAEYEVSFPVLCDDCVYRRYCLGIHKTYINHIGIGEFAPPPTGIEVIEDKENFKHHPILKMT